MLVGNLGFGTVDALNASVASMLGAMTGLHSTAAAGGTMLMPPTADTTSALAVTQQQVNFAQFHSMMLMSLEQLGERTASIELANTAQQVSEAGSAAGFGF